MNGNLMFLVCTHHPDRAEAFLLCVREVAMGDLQQYELNRDDPRPLHKWLKTHAHCGGGFDHFTIAYQNTKDHDLPKPAPLANGVHSALRAANDPELPDGPSAA